LILEGLGKVKLVVEAEQIGEFLVGERVARKQLPCPIDAPFQSIARGRLANQLGELFAKTFVAHAAGAGQGLE
jgi:hypothetical protein